MLALVEGVEPDDGVGDLVVDVGDRVEHALAAVAVAAVAQLDRLELRRWTRPTGPSARPAAPESRIDLDLDRGVATRVEDLAADDVLDDAHGADVLLVVDGC